MIQPSPIESRIATLISAYAEHAPTSVDALAMSRSAASSAGMSRPTRLGAPPALRAVGFAAIVVALAAALVGSALLAAGRAGVTEPTLVAPFAGLPPVDAVPSTPEAGALVVSYLGPLSARSIGDLPIDVGLRPGGWHQVYLYADGRLVRAGHEVGLVEQRLTPLGVDLMRAEAERSVTRTLATERRGATGLYLGRAGGLVRATRWEDPTLPARLAHPEAWLPDEAWLERRIGGFVPTRYRVCARPVRGFEVLPDAPRAFLADEAVWLDIPPDRGPWCPYAVTLDDARALMATLVAAGLTSEPFGLPGLVVALPNVRGVAVGGFLVLAPVLPGGEVFGVGG